MARQHHQLLQILDAAQKSISGVLGDGTENLIEDPLLGSLQEDTSTKVMDTPIDKNESEFKSIQEAKPVRPLSAYNMFFQLERERILEGDEKMPQKFTSEQIYDVINKRHNTKGKEPSKRKHCRTHGKIGFTELARSIAQKWKNLDKESMAKFEAHADEERTAYKKKMEEWNKVKAKIVEKQAAQRMKEFVNANFDTKVPSFQNCSSVSSLPPNSLTAQLIRGSEYAQQQNSDYYCWKDNNGLYDFGYPNSELNAAHDLVDEAYNLTNQWCTIGGQMQGNCSPLQYQDQQGQDWCGETNYRWNQGYNDDFFSYAESNYKIEEQQFVGPMCYPSLYQNGVSNEMPDSPDSCFFVAQYSDDDCQAQESNFDCTNWEVDYCI